MARHPLLDWPALAAEYASYHRTPGNRACHGLGIPLIMLALIRWTQWPQGNPVPLVAALLPVYLVWRPGLALAMAAEAALLSWLALRLSPGAALAAFAAGVALQGIGHSVFESRSPAFTRNLVHLLVGPAWILAKPLGLG